MFRIGLVLALVVAGAVAGATLNIAPLFLAIPLGAIVLVALLLRGRTPRPGDGQPERNRLGAERLEFSERDRRTLTP